MAISAGGSAIYGPVHVQEQATRATAARNRGLALACFLAPWGFVLANSGYTWATRFGGGEETGADTLALAASAPVLLRVVVTAALFGSLLIVPAALGAIRLTRARSPWFSMVGGSLMIAGYICYFGLNSDAFTALAMVEIDGGQEFFAQALDGSQADPVALWIPLLFIAGNLAGTALLAIALLRSRAVARWAALCVLSWPVLHVAGLIAGSEWGAVAGSTLQGVGFAVVGVSLWRSHHLGEPSSESTVAGGRVGVVGTGGK